MPGGFEKRFFSFWLQITDRYWHFRQPRSSDHGHPSLVAGWRPISLRPTYLTLITCAMLLMLITLEALRQYTKRAGGLVLFQDTSDVSASQSLAYNYVPVIIALILSILWSFIDFDVLRLEPYFQLSRPDGCPATTLFINYNFGQTFITPLASLKRKHWIVFMVSILSLMIRIFLPALQSALLELREITVITHEDMNTWSDLVDLRTQARWIAAQEDSAGQSFDAYFSSSDGLRQTRSGEYAVAPVQIPMDDRRETTVWTLNQTIYWAQLSCDNVLTDNDFPFDINDTSGYLSWDVSGVKLPDVDGDGPDCSLDFHYENVFFPDTDFLQVRYWEPTWPDTKFTMGGAKKAFNAHSCDRFDLYGVLLSVNATERGPDPISAISSELTSSATLFACNIQYFQAEAEVTMHANSSITSTDVYSDTAAPLNETQFNIGAFQSLLAHRALYMSDMLFIQINETTGDRTMTELPVISQNLGDLDPVLVLDTSKAMALSEFVSKVSRGVRQSFILTMGRMFNPDAAPTSVPAFRTTRQVAMAVVSGVVIVSEIILGVGVLLTLGMVNFYHKRPNILQSDPGSIGAMCSMLTDILGPNNILASAETEFHQSSTRQLRRLLRQCRLQWFYGPAGKRLEIVKADGSPVLVDDQARSRVDPMPHFLIIPFFIIEFLLLVAVIVAMSFIIASLARDGGFQHLTQSDSSVLQVVLSFLPSVVASAVASLCTSIHRNLSILEPWVHLQRGMATARSSLTMNYSCQNPWSVLPKAAKNRHVLLGLISVACIANTILTLVAGGLFTQQLTKSTLSTSALFANYSHSVFRQTDFAADFTEYDLIQTSITSGVPLLPWTSANDSFAPIEILDPDPDSMYSAITLGIGADLECEVLPVPKSLVTLRDGPYWTYSPFQNAKRECLVKMASGPGEGENISLSINFLSPIAIEDMDECQTSTVMIVGRWNYTSQSPITHANTIALHCEPQARLQNFSITFDQKGQIDDYDPIQHTSIDTGEMYENATVSLGQFNKVFAAIPQSFFGEEQGENGSYVSSYDWAGFLVAHLYKRNESHVTELDPERLIDLSQTVYQWVYSTYFSLWRDIYLLPLVDEQPAQNATIIYSAWCMVPSVPSLVIGVTIIALDTIVVLVVFSARRGRFKGPRMPRSIGAVIPWVANSRMIKDFRGSYGWTNAQRQIHLEKLNKRYAFRTFTDEDGRWRYAVDQEPSGDSDKTMVTTTTTSLPTDGETDTEAVGTKPPASIELHVIENPVRSPESSPERSPERGSERNHEQES